jgi:peptidyl-prolyl cis-trans isomerase A (cyclophilin A)
MFQITALALLLAAASTADGQVQPTPATTDATAPAEAPAPAAETAVPPKPPEPPKPLGPRVVLNTGIGPITIELDRIHAPISTANFLKYVDQMRFDGIKFYRAYKIPYETPIGLIQAGVAGRSDKVLPPIVHEPTSKTGLSHTDGAISMARGAPGTAAGDFFIIIGDLHSLDATDKDPGYAVFGKVVGGMENVLKILNAPTSPTLGGGAMKGQMIEKPVPVATTRRVK